MKEYGYKAWVGVLTVGSVDHYSNGII